MNEFLSSLISFVTQAACRHHPRPVRLERWAVLWGAWWLSSAAFATGKGPNIVFILADDLGYGDVSAYNPESKISTPNLDRLAQGGVRFTDAHAPSSVCTPTRYALLTGRYAWRSPLKGGVLPPWGGPLIEEDRPTLPSFLKQHGYRTAAIGKWHLGWSWPTRDGLPASSGADRLSNVDFTRPIGDGPITRGFDHYFGVDLPNYPPYVYIEDDRTVGIPSQASGAPFNRPGPVLPGWDWTDILPEITRRTVSYIEASAGKDQPYFLYIPLTSPHYPVVPTAEFRGKSGAGDYGDFVLQTDWTVGRILDAIDRSGQSENTLVIFTSDNGPEVTGEVRPGAYDRERDYGHSSSGPLRGAKRDLWEGGHRVPFIARWTGRTKPGTISTETICHVDLFATAAAIIGHAPAGDASPDSFNILPALLGEKIISPLRPATIHHGIRGSLAIRQGQWVLIDSPSGDNNREPEWRKEKWNIRPHSEGAELFDLSTDPRQQHNIISTHRDKARELKERLDQIVSNGRSTPGPPLTNDAAKSAPPAITSTASPAGPWKTGAILAPQDAPKIAGKSFTIHARIAPGRHDGVIISQGGARHGYTLYQQGDRLIFTIRADRKLTTATAELPTTTTDHEIQATLEKSGRLSIRLAGAEAATAQATSVINEHPGDPLSVGRDILSPVGEYEAPHEYRGDVRQADVRINDD